MKKIFLLVGGAFLLSQQLSAQTTATQTQHPQKCGMQYLHAKMIADDPSWAQKLEDQKSSLKASADYYNQYTEQVRRGERTASSISAVPVIFHIVVDSMQFNNLGGTAGIIQRCNSQIAVLNADFNHENADSTLIPSSWKDSLYGNAGIHFGLARIDPSGNCSPGYEIKIISGTTLTDAGFSNENNAFSKAKTASTGLAAWDITKYYNVWCINYTGGASGLLGLTVPLSQASYYPANSEGVCILYYVLGSKGSSSTPPAGTGNWYLTPDNYAEGRTLTHETGHFFEIWHPWGDDGPIPGVTPVAGDGYCPWAGTTCSTSDAVIGSDDGLDDTPPESQAVYGNPAYTIAGGTYNDCCNMHGTVNTQPIGIACLSYMDYTDDNAMHLFTPEQAAAMASMVLVPPSSGTGATGSGTIGENYNLTQNPSLLVACSATGVAPSPTELNSSLSVYPNPTTGEVNISVNSTTETLNDIIVINLLGQQVMTVKGQNKDYYSLDLSNMSKGVYFIKCNFASGSVTRKILLQ